MLSTYNLPYYSNLPYDGYNLPYDGNNLPLQDEDNLLNTQDWQAEINNDSYYSTTSLENPTDYVDFYEQTLSTSTSSIDLDSSYKNAWFPERSQSTSTSD